MVFLHFILSHSASDGVSPFHPINFFPPNCSWCYDGFSSHNLSILSSSDNTLDINSSIPFYTPPRLSV